MEKPLGRESSILFFLSKNGGVCFTDLPYCPGHEKRPDYSNKPKPNAGRRFSNTVLSIIPKEAIAKTINGSFKTKEPTSPKVSCMGQIKHKNQICKAQCVPPPQHAKNVVSPFLGGTRNSRKPDMGEGKVPNSVRAPTLGQMKRFAGGRGTYANFSWKVEGGAVSDCSVFCCRDEMGGSGEESEYASPHLVPSMVRPKKEINLWKRRTIEDAPQPLQLNGLRK